MAELGKARQSISVGKYIPREIIITTKMAAEIYNIMIGCKI